jgi:hypothetical protein
VVQRIGKRLYRGLPTPEEANDPGDHASRRVERSAACGNFQVKQTVARDP